MKEQILTTAIVLARTDFQEADRILTLLTPDRGKLKVIAKGVRRPRSKLAGGIELLSVSHVAVLPGRGDLGTLVSSRLITHYGSIVQDIKRTMLTYDLLKRINRVTEDEPGEEYFTLLRHGLEALNDLELSAEIVELWFTMQLLHITGHIPNLKTDSEGQSLRPDQHYLFDFENMSFRIQDGGPYQANHIKLLRLSYATDHPAVLKQVTDATTSVPPILKLTKNLLQQHVRI